MTPTEERYHQAHRNLVAAQMKLGEAASFLEGWAPEDDEGSRFSDNARMMIDGIDLTIAGLVEFIWIRYSKS